MAQDSSVDIASTEILNLSITDVFILQYLRRFQGPSVKIVLLESLNAFLQNDSISTSSFYSKLDRLERKGLVQYQKKDNKVLVEVTERANVAMKEVNQITLLGSVDFYSETLNILEDLLTDLPFDPESEQFENALIINLEEGIDVNSLQMVTQFSDTTYIIADDEIYERYLGRGLDESILQSKFLNGKIREPGEVFDIVLIIGIDCRQEEIEEIYQWLDEAYRVLKNDGLLLLNTIAKTPQSDHFLINSLIQSVEDSGFFKTSSRDEVKELIERHHYENIEIKNYNGFMFGWGRAKK